MSNHIQISKLRKIIEEAITPLINDDYTLLDVPMYNNIGDSLIYEGELAFLKGLPYKKLFAASRKFTYLNRIPKKGIILLQGGGNFGDLWRVFQDFRLSIIKARPEQRIILFPQTVFYENEATLISDAAIFNAHPDLTICARDEPSYRILKKYFYNNRILLVPDMAFCLDLTKYISQEKTGKALLLKRRDKELKADQANQLEHKIKALAQAYELDIEDWPGIEIEDQQKLKWGRFKKINLVTTRTALFLRAPMQPANLEFGLFNLFQSNRQLERGIRFINSYDQIYSTRLHGAILSVLLEKPISLLDNSYGKNSAFYNCWLKDIEQCKLIS